jgi:hypothetical protein
MAVGSALYKYNIKANNIISLRVKNFDTWKTKQIACLANYVSTAKLIIKYKEVNAEGKNVRCRLITDVTRQDTFLTADPETVYSFNNEKKFCAPETELQKVQRKECLEKPCIVASKEKLYRDITDNCTCKSIWDFPQYLDLEDKFDDFFNPAKFLR